jgi:simple sugar transport system permease protein
VLLAVASLGGLAPISLKPDGWLPGAMPMILLALAAALALVGGSVDLSLGAACYLSAMLAATLPATLGLPALVGPVAGLAAATSLGIVTGWLVHVSRARSWLVSGLILLLVAGLSPWTGSLVRSVLPADGLVRWAPLDWATPSLTLLTVRGQPGLPALPLSFWLVLLLLIALPLALRRTIIGNRMLALGADERIAERLGLPILSTRLVLFATTGFLAGLAGVLIRLPDGLLAPSAPMRWSFEPVLALVIGGAFGRDRRAAFLGVALAALLIQVAAQGAPAWGGTRLPLLAAEALLAILVLLWSRPGRPFAASPA